MNFLFLNIKSAVARFLNYKFRYFHSKLEVVVPGGTETGRVVLFGKILHTGVNINLKIKSRRILMGEMTK
jgi:hypothetical protein